MIVVDAARYDEEDLLVAIDAGAEDISLDDDVFEIITEPGDLGAVRGALTAGRDRDRVGRRHPAADGAGAGAESDAVKLLKLIDMLEESDDVNAVHANFDVDADVLEKLAG